jgi:hypothetical protein
MAKRNSSAAVRRERLTSIETEDWFRAVVALCDDIESWSKAKHWSVHRDEKTIVDDDRGPYSVDRLTIATPQGRILINPIGADVTSADGRVDIEAFPALVRLALLRKGEKWELRTDSGIKWPEPWGRKTFQNVALELCKT